jgi:hypothetical protein
MSDNFEKNVLESEGVVLCGSNSYQKKFFLNPEFNNLPDRVKDELKIMCVLFTEDVSGILLLEYDDEGNLNFKVMSEEYDPAFDEIGSELKIRQLQKEKRDLLEALEMFYKVFVLNEVE